MKRFLLLLVLFTSVNGYLYSQVPDSLLQLEHIIQEVISNNPNLESYHQQWDASRTRISQAQALPDPVLGLNLMNLPMNSFSFNQEPMTGKQLTIMQMFPFPGKLDLQGSIAESESMIAEQQFHELQNQLIKQAKLIYYDLSYVEVALETVHNNKDLLSDFVSIAETRYEVGRGLQQDVLRAQVALSKMIDQELKLIQKKVDLQAQLNALMNKPANLPLGKAVISEQLKIVASLDSLMLVASSKRPLLKAWNIKLDQSEQRVNLAQKNLYPDFSVGVAYTQRNELDNGMNGYDFLSAMFSIKVPIYSKNKQSQKLQETRILQGSTESNLESIRSGIEEQIQLTLSSIQKNQQLLHLYETGILPQAEESLESSMYGYQNDKVDFLSLLDSELTLFNFRLEYYRFLADYQKDIAALEALIGTQL